MNQTIWGLVLVVMLFLNIGFGVMNMNSYLTIGDIWYLALGIFSFAVAGYMMYVITQKWYPTYQLTQKMGKSDWRS